MSLKTFFGLATSFTVLIAEESLLLDTRMLGKRTDKSGNTSTSRVQMGIRDSRPVGGLDQATEEGLDHAPVVSGKVCQPAAA